MISDQNLKGYKSSTTLPDPYGYTIRQRNPIFAVLADQARNDEDFPNEMTEKDLSNGIIRSLEDKSLDWPETNLISRQEWINGMKSNLAFYFNFSKNTREFQAFDDHLIQICANYLKRSIKLIPFPEGEPRIFHPKSTTGSTKYFHILSSNTAFRDSFAVSIFKNPEEESTKNPEEETSKNPERESTRSFFKNLRSKVRSLFNK